MWLSRPDAPGFGRDVPLSTTGPLVEKIATKKKDMEKAAKKKEEKEKRDKERRKAKEKRDKEWREGKRGIKTPKELVQWLQRK